MAETAGDIEAGLGEGGLSMYVLFIALMVAVLLWDGVPEFGRVILVLLLAALAVWTALDGQEPPLQDVPRAGRAHLFFP